MKNNKGVDEIAIKNKISIVVDDRLGSGEIANRTAVLATGLAAQHKEIIGEDAVTADGMTLPGFTKVPISVLSVNQNISISELFFKSCDLGCTSLVFLARAQGVRSYSEYIQSISKSKRPELDIDAFITFGPHKKVNKITGNLPLLR